MADALYMRSNSLFKSGLYQLAYDDLKQIYDNKDLLSIVTSDSYPENLRGMYGWHVENNGIEPSIAAHLGTVVYRSSKAGFKIKIDPKHDALIVEYVNRAGSLASQAETALAAGNTGGVYHAYLRLDQSLFYVSNNTATLLKRAYIEVIMKQYDAARIDLKLILKNNPNNGEAIAALADLDSKHQEPADNSHRMHFEIVAYINRYFKFWENMNQSAKVLSARTEEYSKKVKILDDVIADDKSTLTSRNFCRDRLKEALGDAERTLIALLNDIDEYIRKEKPFMNSNDEARAVDDAKELRAQQKLIADLRYSRNVY